MSGKYEEFSERADSGETEAGKMTAGKTEAGETEAGKTEYGETETGETAAGKTAAGKTAAGKIPPGELVSAKRNSRTAGIRALLPPQTWEDFDGITEQRILGATRHVELIGGFLEAAAEDSFHSGVTAQAMADRVQKIADYFIETRGEASQAVVNALRIMTRNLRRHGELEAGDARDAICKDVEDYRESSGQAAGRVTEYAKRVASGMERILLFDYSSTVQRMLEALSGDKKARTLYIAESRLIDGGKPYLKSCLSLGYRIHFIPDAALWYAIRRCDGVFMGAETIFPDGTCFNTIGADIVGLVCRHCHVPLYFLSPLIKLDFRPLEGIGKRLVQNGLGSKMRTEFEELGIGSGTAAVEFSVPELIGVRPELIEAVVTEEGVIPPHGIYEVSLRYREAMKSVRPERKPAAGEESSPDGPGPG